MKKLITILLLMTTMFSVKAQEGKPTKEQTVAFIQDYYLNIGSMYITDTNSRNIVSKGYDNFIIEFSENNSIMTFSYQFSYNYTSVTDSNLKDNYTIKNKTIIDFRKIEQISLGNILSFKENSEKISRLKFKTASGSQIENFISAKNGNIPQDLTKVNEALIPVKMCDGCDVYEENKKILQAFNHLRKLCGAPEPINFD